MYTYRTAYNTNYVKSNRLIYNHMDIEYWILIDIYWPCIFGTRSKEIWQSSKRQLQLWEVHPGENEISYEALGYPKTFADHFQLYPIAAQNYIGETRVHFHPCLHRPLPLLWPCSLSWASALLHPQEEASQCCRGPSWSRQARAWAAEQRCDRNIGIKIWCGDDDWRLFLKLKNICGDNIGQLGHQLSQETSGVVRLQSALRTSFGAHPLMM